jgi:hypothetical protein
MALIQPFSGLPSFLNLILNEMKRDELYPGSRSLSYEQYLIFYRLLEV